MFKSSKDAETRTLFLLRHASAENAASDKDRKLSDVGRAEARKLGLVMRERKYKPEVVYCSTARRAKETLDELKLFAKFNYRDDAYNATAEQLFALIQKAGDVPSLLVVAHNPGIHTLAAGLAGHGEARLLQTVNASYPPATLSVLTFTGGWATLAPRAATLASLIFVD